MNSYKSNYLASKSMNQMLILQGITVDELLQKVEALIEKKLTTLPEKKEEKNRYMLRKEVSEYLHISLPTLNDWTKEGLIVSHRIGNRVLYKAEEVEKAVNIRKFHRYR